MDVKNFGLIVAKNALNALLTNSTFMALMPGVFNIHSSAGWWNLLKAAGGVVAAREGAVWFPILLHWTTTNADPGVKVIETPPGQQNIVEVVKPVEPPKP